VEDSESHGLGFGLGAAALEIGGRVGGGVGSAMRRGRRCVAGRRIITGGGGGGAPS
jgi:hypothetical protein